MIVLMVVLLVFARLTVAAKGQFVRPAKLLLWSSVIIAVSVAVLLTTSVFFRWPVSLQHWLTPTQPVQRELAPVPPVSQADATLVFREKVESVEFSLGARGMTYHLPALPNAVATKFIFRSLLGERIKFAMDSTHDDIRLSCDLEFVPKFGFPPLKLERNTISGRPREWDLNRNDKALEVVNEKQVPILQIYYKDGAHIVLNGVFPGEHGIVIATESGTQVMNDAGFKATYPDGVVPVNVRRLFKYPAFKHPGQFDDN